MKPANSNTKIIALIAVLAFLPTISHATNEFATFESFYRESSNFLWIIVVAAIAGLLAGAVIFFTGGTASSIVVSMGTWVGGLMGLSGIAATNAGLALLGGGSLITGGFGILGGATLLTAVLTFSTTVFIDYATDRAVETYSYSEFAKNSKLMTTLPMPRNTSGPDAYENALDELEEINDKEVLFSSQNQSVIQKAIKSIGRTHEDLSHAETSRVESLLALLYFSTTDYASARVHAENGYLAAQSAKTKRTLPAFILAVSSMYDETPDFKKSIKYFNYSVTGEKDNPLSPLMFAVYLDRLVYRFNDGYLNYSSLDSISNIADGLPYDERRALIQVGLLIRYFTYIKLEQQKVLSLATTSNQTIKNSPKTLETVSAALHEYSYLLARSRTLLDDQSSYLNSKISRTDDFEEWETKWKEKLVELNSLWSSYSNGVTGLEGVVRTLRRFSR